MSLRLLRVELSRLRSRRAVLALVGIAVLLPAVLVGFRIHDTSPLSAEDRSALIADNQVVVEDCLDRPRQFSQPRGATRAQCESVVVEWYGARQTLVLANERENIGYGVATILVVCLMLLGTTFAGHDWNTGSMSNQLLFEPRRLRLWATKAAAVTLLSGVVATAVSLAAWAALWLTVRSRDLPIADGELRDVVEFSLRGAGFATAAALGAFALTMLVRSTVVTLGVLFGVSLVSGILLATLGVSGRWSPPVNFDAILSDGSTYFVEVPPTCFGERPTASGPECDGERTVSLADGVGYYGVLLLGIGGASVLSFRRRDVP